MRRTFWSHLAALLLLITPDPCAAAAGAASIVNEAVIDAPAGEVWRLITTKEGMESWIVPHAEIDLRVGGLLRTNHDPEGTIGDSKTVTNRILAVEPKRFFSLKVAGTPAWVPFADYVTGTWYEILLSPLPHGRTRVRCLGYGFGKGPLQFAARAFVDRGNVWALDRLRKLIAERNGAKSHR
ncbi:MAG: SRPBCC domain-containing protein [Candidatus Latescibacteria bacterium]|nr:SRPBCC domain-containing protein [Candidatus Latescibacterota bacterium]